jgi:hypothetical protein
MAVRPPKPHHKILGPTAEPYRPLDTTHTDQSRQEGLGQQPTMADLFVVIQF